MRSVVLFAVLGLATVATAGTIRGRIDVTEKGGRKATDVADAVVYLDGVNVKPKPAKATITMKGKSFFPRVVAVPVGGTVEFPNDDPLFHNVFSVSGDNRFDLPLYRKPKTGSWTFQHPGVVRVYCNIHPQMSAVIVVRDNPYFTKANPDGTFAIADVPPGKYSLRGWHERGGEAEVEVTVPAQGDVSADLVLDATSFKRVPHKKKDGKDYSSDETY